jgi:hypothetical protein
MVVRVAGPFAPRTPDPRPPRGAPGLARTIQRAPPLPPARDRCFFVAAVWGASAQPHTARTLEIDTAADTRRVSEIVDGAAAREKLLAQVRLLGCVPRWHGFRSRVSIHMVHAPRTPLLRRCLANSRATLRGSACSPCARQHAWTRCRCTRRHAYQFPR